MKIGSHQLKNSVILAPMAGVTDLPFRQLCTSYGAAAAVSEMLSADPQLWQTQKSLKRMDHSDEAGIRWIQIAGSDANMMAHAARFNADIGAQIIDINMGCPAKKVCNKAAGSALLSKPKQVQKILQSVVAAVDIPVTLKIRTGSDPENKNALEIAQIAEQSGIKALSIHGRTRACKFNGHAEYQTIKMVKQSVKIPVIANGDINTPQQAKAVLDFTGADGIMVGRAAQGRPWIFREIAHYLQTGKIYPQATAEEIISILSSHVDALHSFYGEHLGVRIARKHVGWYLKNLGEKQAFRKQFNKILQASEQLRLIKTLLQEEYTLVKAS